SSSSSISSPLPNSSSIVISPKILKSLGTKLKVFSSLTSREPTSLPIGHITPTKKKMRVSSPLTVTTQSSTASPQTKRPVISLRLLPKHRLDDPHSLSSHNQHFHFTTTSMAFLRSSNISSRLASIPSVIFPHYDFN
ncbi:hypothetical protein PENTCL1PPCAC_7013, partial [Pristionchus entomophagus]